MVMDLYQVSQKIWRYQAGNQKPESKDRQYNGPKENGVIDKTLHRKLMFEQQESDLNTVVNSGAPGG